LTATINLWRLIETCLSPSNNQKQIQATTNINTYLMDCPTSKASLLEEPSATGNKISHNRNHLRIPSKAFPIRWCFLQGRSMKDKCHAMFLMEMVSSLEMERSYTVDLSNLVNTAATVVSKILPTQDNRSTINIWILTATAGVAFRANSKTARWMVSALYFSRQKSFQDVSNRE